MERLSSSLDSADCSKGCGGLVSCSGAYCCELLALGVICLSLCRVWGVCAKFICEEELTAMSEG